MQNPSFQNSSRTALGGIVAALSITLMLLTTVIPVLSYALPAIAGVLLMLIVIEVDKKWAFGVYAAVSILSLLILPDKEAAMMYVFFFGHYPILKAILESRLHKVWLWLSKFFIFNVSVVAAYLVVIYVFQLPFTEMEEYGKWAVWGLLGLGNLVFIPYDIALSRLVMLYEYKLRKPLRKLFHF